MDGARVSSDTIINPMEGAQETTYIPIRILGRGAFGEAVLYRKSDDNSLVVWKEINLQRLGEKERSEAQNEIDILAMLNHANIISYYNHFLDGDTLLIEMEYANGGTLYEKIAAQEKIFEEEVVLWYFYQLISAVAHIHDYSILHRDIKTLNIFLTKNGLAKLGDFGISKILGNSEMADSYVGTPYYMSPELIRGDRYSQPSDIWAAGCVLYELLTLTRVFDATNPLRLAHDIVLSEVKNEINTVYSGEIISLVNSMLNKEAVLRPTAENILQSTFISAKASEFDQKIWNLNSGTRRAKVSSSTSGDVLPVVTSKSSEVFIWGGGKVTPQNLELFTKGRAALQVSVGKCHFAVVTVEKELYTWANPQGGQIVGQLGHGDAASYKAPKKVDSLEGKLIKQVSCGEDFTMCVTDDGQLYGFGSDYFGCLGCDNKHGNEVLTPVIVDYFALNPVEKVSCGNTHVIALTQAGDVYTWGSGEFGQLGHGSEDDYSTPKKVLIRGQHGIQSVCAGSEGSFLIKQNGRVLACGSNEFNKLGFNSSAKGLKITEELSYDIPCKYTFTAVKPLSKYNILSMATGTTHTAAVDCFGHLIMFGCNRYGQLGLGDCREHNGVYRISGTLTGKTVTKVACGDGFTVAATEDNQIYSWGLAENGRIGTTLCESHKSEGKYVSTLPRPIFGSLHAVSDVACQHWNTILVAEKVLAQKTIRSTSVLSASSKDADHVSNTTDEEPFEFRTDFLEDSSFCNIATTKSCNESNVPDWLQAELADSEFIPASQENSENKTNVDSPADSQLSQSETQGDPKEHKRNTFCEGEHNVSKQIYDLQTHNDPQDNHLSESTEHLINNSMTESLRNELGASEHLILINSQSRQDALVINQNFISGVQRSISVFSGNEQSPDKYTDLQEKIKQLEAENIKLQELVYHQAETIRTQATTIAHLEDKYKYQQEIQNQIWTLIETWQQEWYTAMGRTGQSVGGCYDVSDNVIQNRVLRHQDSDTDTSATTPLSSQRGSIDMMVVAASNSNNSFDMASNTSADNSPGVLLDWNNLGSPDEIKTWSKSKKIDMLKSYSPGKMVQSLKGVTTTEEML